MSIALSSSFPSFDVSRVLTPYAPDTTIFNPIVMTEMLGYHPLTRPFTDDIIHTLSYESDLVSLDHKVASTIYNCLCDIFYAIHKAGTSDADAILKNNSDVVFHLPPIPNYRFSNAGLAAPAILELMPRFTQNPFLIAGTREYIRKVYCLAQVVGMNSLEWISKARMVCARDEDGFGWRWDNVGHDEDIVGLGPTVVNSLIEAPAALRTENNGEIPDPISRHFIIINAHETLVRDMIVHPRYSNWTRLHPEYDPARPILDRLARERASCYPCSRTQSHTVRCYSTETQLDASSGSASSGSDNIPMLMTDSDGCSDTDPLVEYGTEYDMEEEDE